jgi:Dolichyl-phosphate-mannose-protein mannosyltransferase
MSKKALTIFLIALSVRLVYLWIDGRGQGEIVDDAVGYHVLAINLLERHAFIDNQDMRATRMPLYPLVIAAIYKIVGQHALAIQLIQCGLNAIACVFLFWGARRLVPEPWAFVGGIMSCFYFDFFTGCTRILTENLFIFVFSLFLMSWLLLDRTKKSHVLLLGALMSLTIMIRPDPALFAVLFGFLLLRKPLKQGFTLVVIFWLGCGIFLGPWIIRNYVVLNHLVPLTTKGGLEVYRGLHDVEEHLGLVEHDPIPLLSSSEVANDRLYKEKGIQLYKDTPPKTLIKVMILNLVVLIYPFRPAYDPTLIFLLPFWLIGLWTAVREKNPDSGILLLYVSVSAVLYMFLGSMVARHRESLAPCLILLSAIGLYQVAQRLDLKKFRYYLGGWGFINLIIWWQAHGLRQTIIEMRNHFIH